MVIVTFGGTEGPGPRLLSITGGFRAGVCKQTHFAGSDENNTRVALVKTWLARNLKLTKAQDKNPLSLRLQPSGPGLRLKIRVPSSIRPQPSGLGLRLKTRIP